MSTPAQIVFESKAHYDLYTHLFPGQKGSVKLASDLLLEQTNISVSSGEKRLQQLAHFLTLDDKKELARYLKTLEQLRLSLIISREQTDFCFSLLYPTPKNNLLKNSLYAYLDSPLRNDLAEAYWRAIEKLKEKQLDTLAVPRVFVKGRGSTFLFSEWAKSHQYFQDSTCEPIELWELFASAPNLTVSAQKPITGSAAHILKELAHNISKTFLSSNKRQIVAFGGAPHALLYFESCLSHFRVPFTSLFCPSQATDNNSVLVFPFQSLPLFEEFSFWSYVDETFFSPEEKLILTEPELFTLMNGGFQIPRLSTDRKYLKTMLNHSQGVGKERLFFSSQLVIEELNEAETLSNYRIPNRATPMLKLPIKETKLSATQLETYAACPAKYLVRHRLKLRPEQSLEEKYPLIFGKAVHAALEAYFLNPKEPLSKIFEDVLSNFDPDLVSTNPIYTMMVQQFQEMKEHFLSLEKQLKNDFGYQSNLGLEKQFEITIESFTFIGTIDRIIDQNATSQLLIDYKTGTVDFSPTHIPSGDHCQALLYILAMREQTSLPCSGVLFYDLKKGELRRGIFDEQWVSKELKNQLTRGHVLPPAKFEEVLNAGKLQMLETSKAIRLGEFSAKPSPQECPRCESATFCLKGLGYV